MTRSSSSRSKVMSQFWMIVARFIPKINFKRISTSESCLQCRPHDRAQKPNGTKPKMKSNWMSWWRMTLSRSTSEAARLRICWLKLQVPNISTRISPRTPFAEPANEQGWWHLRHERKCGQKRIETEVFGDHIIGDHVIIKKNVEEGFRGSKLHWCWKICTPNIGMATLASPRTHKAVLMVWITSLDQRMMFKLCTLTIPQNWSGPSRIWVTDTKLPLNM